MTTKSYKRVYFGLWFQNNGKERLAVLGAGSWVIHFKTGCKFHHKVSFHLHAGSRGRRIASSAWPARKSQLNLPQESKEKRKGKVKCKKLMNSVGSNVGLILECSRKSGQRK